jgi:hypothetical protein
MGKYTAIYLLLYMIGIMSYTIFMNEKSVSRDLFFFSLQFGIGGILCFHIYKLEFIVKRKIIYFFGIVFNVIFLLMIYAIYLVSGADNYFNKMASEKIGLVAGTMIFFVILGIKILTIKK